MLFLLPSARNRGGGGGPLRRSIPAARGSTAARDRGKRERVGRRFDPRPHLVPGWSVAVRPRKPAAARVSERRRRCRVAERGRGVAAQFEVAGVVLGGGSAASFIGGQGGGAGSKLWAASTEVLC